MATTNKARSLVRLSDSDLELADKAEDIRGRKVVDKNGDEIGHVDDLFVDETAGKVRFLQVAAGGFLGLGEKKFLVPVDAITRIDDEHVHIDQTRQQVIGAPEYNPTLEEKDDNDYWSGLYGHYGYTPYWGPGYTYPPYPYYRLP